MYLNEFLFLAAFLFCTGVYGVLARKNGVLVLMSIELILNAVNINLVAFGAFGNNVAGQVFALFVIAIAAAEVGVGLAIVLLIYRNRSIDLDRGRPDEGLGTVPRSSTTSGSSRSFPRRPSVVILFFGKRLPNKGAEVGDRRRRCVVRAVGLVGASGSPPGRRAGGTARSGRSIEHNFTWFSNGQVNIQFGTHVDGLAVMMLFVVTTIS